MEHAGAGGPARPPSRAPLYGPRAALVWFALAGTFAACSGRVSAPLAQTDAGHASSSVDHVLYWQWWYPECGVAAGAECTKTCSKVDLIEGPADYCGSTSLTTGCFPGGVTDGDFCYLSTEYNRYILTEFHPYTMEGLRLCTNDGNNVPPCRPDGGSTSSGATSTTTATATETITASDAGASSADCAALKACCPSLPSTEKMNCTKSLEDSYAAGCTAELAALKTEGECGAPSGVDTGACHDLIACCGRIPTGASEVACYQAAARLDEARCQTVLDGYVRGHFCEAPSP